jgi:hypothetical protein
VTDDLDIAGILAFGRQSPGCSGIAFVGGRFKNRFNRLLEEPRDTEGERQAGVVLPRFDLEAADYEEAAHINNRCRIRGTDGSAVDFLICAAAHRRGWAIFTTDRDFQGCASVLPLRFHVAPKD